jgi:HSP20 family molecular chaperone IbpA
MSSCRPAITRTLPRALSRRTSPNKTIAIRPLTTTSSNKMSAFFPRTLYGADPSFTPLFRLLDDFDNYSREVGNTTTTNGRHHGRHGGHVRAFNPKFDVRETEEAYELHGELPGIAREQVNIEFTEPQTLVVRGRVERSYTSGTPPAALEGGPAKAAITQGEAASHSHKTTVTDEEFENVESGSSAETAQPAGEVAKTEKKAAAEEPKEKYWVSERSVGEFSRTFSFPGRIDQDAVSANLNNGILSIVVPKAKKAEARRIAIN